MWTVSFRQDTELKGVGSLTASYDDTLGITCAHTARVDTNSDFGAFVQACRDVLAKTTLQRSELLAVAAKVELVLNGA